MLMSLQELCNSFIADLCNKRACNIRFCPVFQLCRPLNWSFFVLCQPATVTRNNLLFYVSQSHCYCYLNTQLYTQFFCGELPFDLIYNLQRWKVLSSDCVVCDISVLYKLQAHVVGDLSHKFGVARSVCQMKHLFRIFFSMSHNQFFTLSFSCSLSVSQLVTLICSTFVQWLSA